ncbi:hypothetical protein Tcan_00649, partial [Toxocara canis]
MPERMACALPQTLLLLYAAAILRSKAFDYDPLLVSFNATMTFYENDTKLLTRTSEVYIDYRSCLEYRIRIEGKRTRVRVYGCRMSEGGRCTFDGYRGNIGTLDHEHCHSIRAWMHRADRYAFFFAFERRQRNFHDMWRRQRHLRRLREKPFAVQTEPHVLSCIHTAAQLWQLPCRAVTPVMKDRNSLPMANHCCIQKITDLFPNDFHSHQH